MATGLRKVRAALSTPDPLRSLSASIAAHESWANTTNRSARTAPARAALDQKFLDQVSGDPVRAEHLRRAYYKRLALKSAQARRRAKSLLHEADEAEQHLRELLEPSYTDGGRVA